MTTNSVDVLEGVDWDSRDARYVRAELARELHDRVAQALTTMLIEMEHFKVDQYGRTRVLAELDTYQESTREVLGNIREVLFQLRGEEELWSDFIPRLRSKLQRFESKAGIRSSLIAAKDWPDRIAAPAGLHVTRIVDEALANVHRHSGATEVSVELGVQQRVATLAIRDNGRGIQSEEALGFGLRGMRERALILGGELEVVAATPQGGTIVRATIPTKHLV